MHFLNGMRLGRHFPQQERTQSRPKIQKKENNKKRTKKQTQVVRYVGKYSRLGGGKAGNSPNTQQLDKDRKQQQQKKKEAKLRLPLNHDQHASTLWQEPS